MSGMNPTYQAGFASPQRGRLKYPGLWRGCVFAAAPCLGQTGLVLRDHSGYGNHGTLTNGPTWASSEGKTAIQFDGSNDQIITTTLSPDTFTWSVWFNTSNGGPLGTLISDNSASYMLMDIYNNAGSFWSSDGMAGTTLDVTGIANNTWWHLTLTRAGDSVTNGYTAWLNGNKKASANSGTWSPGESIYIGARRGVGAQYFIGKLDDIRIYNRVLAPQEIKQLASRRGIAYERARRVYSIPFAPSFNRNNMLMGTAY